MIFLDRITSHRTSLSNILLLYAGVFFVVILLRAGTSFSEVVAIVNQGNNLTQISLGEIRNIYLGKTKNWNNGKRIVLFLPRSNGVSMDTLAKKILKLKDESEIPKLYLKLIFRQVLSTPPIPVLNTDDATVKVAASPGGIAIVESSELSQEGPVRIVKVVGSR
jgi:hypothetical protein